jgi:hypothetical protein
MKVRPPRAWAESLLAVFRSSVGRFRLAAIRALLWGALILSYSGHSAVSFSPAQVIPGLGFIDYVSLHDINQDGLSDIIASGSALNVLIRQPQGGFVVRGSFRETAETISCADVNNDSLPDLVGTYTGASVLSIFLATNGHFSQPISRKSTRRIAELALADYNNDGRMDYATANENLRSVTVYPGDGNAGFVAPGISYAIKGTPFSIVTGDLDGDGYLDLVTANGASNSIAILYGTRGARFQAPVYRAVGRDARQVRVGDLNADRRLDIVCANFKGNSLSVLLSQGSRQFTTAIAHRVGDGPLSLDIGDLDGDSRSDLIAGNYYSRTVTILRNRGGGTFARYHDLSLGGSPYSVRIGDINSDSRPDIVTGNFGNVDASLTILANTTN